MCSLTHYIQTLSMVTSIMTLTAISLERYYAISRPLRAKYICTASHARSVIVAIWITASILSLPILFVQKHYKTGLHDPVYWCDKYTSSTDKKGQLLTIAFEVYMLSLLFLLPVITMAIAYAGVCIELWAVTESVNQSGGGRCSKREGKLDGSPAPSEIVDEKLLSKTHNRDAQVRGQVLKMLFMVVIIFIICWCPILSYNLAVAMGTVVPYFPQEYPYAKPMNTAFSLLAYCNSCLNPIVYGFMSRYFRKSFKQALSLCCMLKRYKQHVYLRKAFTQNDRSSSSTRKPGEQTYGNDAPKATITTMAADSSLSRSPPISPNNSYPRQ
ncbi:QRFP-like peptide receptor [Watersipora subatra]|uniref:QRFP-like peptide receptor n=1 Tax=Watersipora subatra TaxID=2589382 RepID=UPI00355BE214